MIYCERRFSFSIFSIFILLVCLIKPVHGQKNEYADLSDYLKDINIKQDTTVTKKQNIPVVQPDTNFTWEKYARFLNKISDTSKYIVLPLNEFRQTFNSKKIVIGLRHDIDNDLNVAYKFSQVEYSLGYRSTYFILHTAPYYLKDSGNMSVHSDKIIPILKKMQNERHFEIGWHNDLVTLQVVYDINPVTFLHNELHWLRANGLKIYGTAAHGSSYCKSYHYMNFYFFEECSNPVVPNRENNVTVPYGGKSINLIKANLSDFDLKYEAYFLNNNKAYSDATITNGIRWNIGMLNLNQLQAGDRVIILLHPIHWHKAAVNANIEYFWLPGQISSSIDTVNHIVSIEMPSGINLDSLIAEFRLSPGAYAKVDGNMQINKSTRHNFIKPLIYRVYAENRDIQTEWTIEVHNEKKSALPVL